MDEDKIPKKGILGNIPQKNADKNIPFDIPQKNPSLLLSEGIVFDVPQKEQTPSETVIPSIPQKKQTEETVDILRGSHLPEQSKILEPTIDMSDIAPIEKTKESHTKTDDIPQQNTSAKKISILPKEKLDEIKTQTKVDPSDIPTLRTYKKDVAGVIKDQKTSLVRMVLEEQKNKYKKEERESPKSRKNITLIVLSTLFFLATAGVVYYTFFLPSKGEQLLTEVKVVPLISTEQIQEISTDEKNEKVLSQEIQQEVTSSKPKLDTVKYLFFTETLLTQTDTGLVKKKNLISAKKIIEKLEIPVPQIILRTIKDDFMFGYHTFNGNQPFLILKTDYYDNAFVGMLGWEGTMAQDLKPLFGTIGEGELGQRTWSDLVTKNKDTRVLYNFDKSIALVYMFKDQNTLIITTNNNTLFELSRRLDVELKKK
ncbi:MAG: hypothetical protein NTZ13_01335 [Candidatus Parcubacteria bacterium]|nr:hypothetical protein [Candidatus Parcubacteria bacterium]